MKKRLAYKWELIIIFWFAYFFNQGDRQVFNVVIPLLKKDLHLTDVELGMVATIFTIVYGCVVPFAGYAGDFIKRKWIIFGSLLIFSLGTLLTGFSGGLVSLIVIRGIVTGGGEAFYYPAATSMISHHHQKTRAVALSIHQTSLYAGIVVSGFIAAYIGEHFGWRSSFFAFGIGGLLLVIYIFFRLKDAPVTHRVEERPDIWKVARSIFTKRTVWMLCLAFGGMVFVNIGYVTWMPTFYYEKFHLSLAEAGFSSMFYHFTFAFIGVLVGGRVSDGWVSVNKKARLIVEFIGLAGGVPFIFLMGYTTSLYISYFALGAFGFFRGLYDSNLFAALFDVIEPKYRATAVGLMTSFAFIVGAFSPLVLGMVKTSYGLSKGISSLGFCYLFSALMILLAIRYFFSRDYYHESSTINQ